MERGNFFKLSETDKAAVLASPVPDFLRVMKDKLSHKKFIVASNLEPYVHRKVKGHLRWEQSAGGVISALDSLLRILQGTWVAWGSGDADRQVVDLQDRTLVPPDRPSYTLRRIWLSVEELELYYQGYSKQFLWPLCHLNPDRAHLNQRYWSAYQRVNEKFAMAIRAEMASQGGMVWIQDYHLALCPLFLKQAQPELAVNLFWHIPWPPPEVFSICPQKKELLTALLSCDQLGFHLDRYRQNFIQCIEQELEVKIIGDEEIVHRGHRTLLSATSVGADFSRFQQRSGSALTAKRIVNLQKRLKIDSRTVVGLGADRLNYTKGLIKRFWALERFLEQNPGIRDRFLFIQITLPSRMETESDRVYRDEVHAAVNRLNEKYGKRGWKPVEYIEGQLTQDALIAYYRIADFCLISSVCDGMNLVAKEYVSSRTDDSGVLILSKLAGVHEELDGALTINPYDIEDIALAIRRAIEMTRDQQSGLMSRMRRNVGQHDVYHWIEANLSPMIRSLA